MKHQFVVTHTIRQTEIPVLLDIWVTHSLSHNVVSTKQTASPYIFLTKHNILKC
jgi:hypothetical protein